MLPAAGNALPETRDIVTNAPRPTDVPTRKATAGRFGFILGCVAAVIAAIINLTRLPRWSVSGVLLAVLMAALNVPLGIGFGLLGEWLTRGSAGSGGGAGPT